MTVEQLIDLLSAVENKKLEVVVNASGQAIEVTGIDVDCLGSDTDECYVWIES